jgi:hypothetical protein
MRHLFLGIFALSLCPACDAPSAQETRVVMPDGFESVQIGMSVDAAETSLGSSLDPRANADPEGCVQGVRVDGKDPEILYMIEGGKIVRIDVVRAGPEGAKPFTSEFGIGVGSTEAELERAYGAKAVQEPHPYTYDEGGHLYIVESGNNALIFETFGGKVTTFRGGAHPQVDYKESCL